MASGADWEGQQEPEENEEEVMDTMEPVEPEVPEGGVEVLPAEYTGGPKEIKEKKTTRYMTKYERARVLGTRALQIRQAEPPPRLISAA